jgi:hypothetical protein
VEGVISTHAAEEEIVDEPVPVLKEADAFGVLWATGVAEGRLDVDKDGILPRLPTARWVCTMPRVSCLTRITKPSSPVKAGSQRPSSPQYMALRSGSFIGV